MARTATSVCHNGTGALHHRLPVGVCHVCHEHIASLDLVHFRNAVHQTHRTCANFLPNGTTFGQHGAFALECVAQLGGSLGLTLHGFGPGLQNVKQAIGTIFAPFNVHGAAIVFFNDHGVLRQLGDVFVAQ